MFKAIGNGFSKVKTGLRNALGYYVVMLVVVAYTLLSLSLLKQIKNRESIIAGTFAPLQNSLKDYQNLIEEGGTIAVSLSEQCKADKIKRLKYIQEQLYNPQLMVVLELCNGPELAETKNKVAGADFRYKKIAKMEKQVLQLNEAGIDANDPLNIQLNNNLKDQIEREMKDLRQMLGETHMQVGALLNALKEQNETDYNQLYYLLLMLFATLILTGIISSSFTIVSINKPVKELSRFLTELAEGKIPAFQTQQGFSGEFAVMVTAAQKIVTGYKNKEQVFHAISKGDYEIRVPLQSKADKFGRAIAEMRDGLKTEKNQKEERFRLMEEKINQLENRNAAPVPVVQVNTESVNSKDLFLEIFQNFRIPNNYAILLDNQLPVVKAVKSELFQVFSTLIGNSLKHNHSPKPIINITCHISGAGIEFCIADNGPEFTHSLFDSNHKKIRQEYGKSGNRFYYLCRNT